MTIITHYYLLKTVELADGSVMSARCYQWNMPKHCFHKMNPQVIPCYPWLYTYITGYPGISLANDAAPGLLLDSPAAGVSPALPVQPGGPLRYVLGGRILGYVLGGRILGRQT